MKGYIIDIVVDTIRWYSETQVILRNVRPLFEILETMDKDDGMWKRDPENGVWRVNICAWRNRVMSLEILQAQWTKINIDVFYW